MFECLKVRLVFHNFWSLSQDKFVEKNQPTFFISNFSVKTKIFSAIARAGILILLTPTKIPTASKSEMLLEKAKISSSKFSPQFPISQHFSASLRPSKNWWNSLIENIRKANAEIQLKTQKNARHLKRLNSQLRQNWDISAFNHFKNFMTFWY